MKCAYGKTIEIMQSDEGYFVGTKVDGKVFCRLSGYSQTEENARKVYEEYRMNWCTSNYRCKTEDGQYRAV